MQSLYKTTIVIWSEYDPTHVALEDLAREATCGDAYCSSNHSEYIKNPQADADWDGTEFFTEFFGDNPADDDSTDEASGDTHVD